MYPNGCVVAGVSVGDGKPILTILFSKHFLFCILLVSSFSFFPLRSLVVFSGLTRSLTHIIVTINEKFFTLGEMRSERILRSQNYEQHYSAHRFIVWDFIFFNSNIKKLFSSFFFLTNFYLQ